MNKTIGVVGGGRMGTGVAQVFAVIGYEVVIIESSDEMALAAKKRIRDDLERSIEHGESEYRIRAASNRIGVAASMSELPRDVALVIEAVPEEDSYKRAVLSSIEAVASPSCIIATNTSSLSINHLASDLELPGRFLGMHFFNPVPSSKLIEVVVGDATLDGTVAQTVIWVRELGKTEIIVHDSPGFATSRLGVLLGIEAIRMLEDGVASADDIDRAMVLGYRHLIGPLRSTDLVGLDVRLAISENLESTLGARFKPPDLLRDKVNRGELGRKSGQGFFSWERKGST